MGFSSIVRRLHALLVIAFFVVAAAPTCGVQEWERSFLGVVDHKVDSASNLYTLEYHGLDGVELKKFDPVGYLLWTSPALDLNYNASTEHAQLDLDAAGGAYVTIPPTWSPTWSSWDMQPVVTAKYDPSGQLVWRADFRPDEGWHHNDYAGLAVDRATGAVYVTASTATNSTDEGALATIKYAADGDQEWVSRWSPGAVAVGLSDDALAVLPDGGAVVLAVRNLPDADVLLRWNAEGNLLWLRSGAINTTRHLLVGGDGAIYAGVWKYALDGEFLGTAPCREQLDAVDGAGNVYCTEGNVTIEKHTPSGELLWSADYVAGDLPYKRALTVDASGNVYLTVMPKKYSGSSCCFPTAVATLKYDPGGKQQWKANYDHPYYDPGWVDIAVVQGSVYVLVDEKVVKYAQVEYVQQGE